MNHHQAIAASTLAIVMLAGLLGMATAQTTDVSKLLTAFPSLSCSGGVTSCTMPTITGPQQLCSQIVAGMQTRYHCDLPTGANSIPSVIDLSSLPESVDALDISGFTGKGVMISSLTFPLGLRSLVMNGNTLAPFPRDFFIKLNRTEGVRFEELDVRNCQLEDVLVDLRKLPPTVKVLRLNTAGSSEVSGISYVAWQCGYRLPEVLETGGPAVHNGTKVMLGEVTVNLCLSAPNPGRMMINFWTCSTAGSAMSCSELFDAQQLWGVFQNVVMSGTQLTRAGVAIEVGCSTATPNDYDCNVVFSVVGNSIASGGVDISMIPRMYRSFTMTGQSGNGNALDLRALPPGLQELTLTGTRFTSLIGGALPPSLATLRLANTLVPGVFDIQRLQLRSFTTLDLSGANLYGELDLTPLFRGRATYSTTPPSQAVHLGNLGSSASNDFHRLIIPCALEDDDSTTRVQLTVAGTVFGFNAASSTHPFECCNKWLASLPSGVTRTQVFFEYTTRTCGYKNGNGNLRTLEDRCQMKVGDVVAPLPVGFFTEHVVYAPFTAPFFVTASSTSNILQKFDLTTRMKTTYFTLGGTSCHVMGVVIPHGSPTVLAVTYRDLQYEPANNHVLYLNLHVASVIASPSYYNGPSQDGGTGSGSFNFVKAMGPSQKSGTTINVDFAEQRCLRRFSRPSDIISTIAGNCLGTALAPRDGLLRSAEFVDIQHFTGAVGSARWYVRDGDYLRKGNTLAVVTLLPENPTFDTPLVGFALMPLESVKESLLLVTAAPNKVFRQWGLYNERVQQSTAPIDASVTAIVHMGNGSYFALSNSASNRHIFNIRCDRSPLPSEYQSAVNDVEHCAPTETYNITTIRDGDVSMTSFGGALHLGRFYYFTSQTVPSGALQFIDLQGTLDTVTSITPTLSGAGLFGVAFGAHCVFQQGRDTTTTAGTQATTYVACVNVIAKLVSAVNQDPTVVTVYRAVGDASVTTGFPKFSANAANFRLSNVTAVAASFDPHTDSETLFFADSGHIFEYIADLSAIRNVTGNGDLQSENGPVEIARVRKVTAMAAHAGRAELYFVEEGLRLRKVAAGVVFTLSDLTLVANAITQIVAHPTAFDTLYAAFNTSYIAVFDGTQPDEKWSISGRDTLQLAADRPFTLTAYRRAMLSQTIPGGGVTILDGNNVRKLRCYDRTPAAACVARRTTVILGASSVMANVYFSLPQHGAFVFDGGRSLWSLSNTSAPWSGGSGMYGFSDGHRSLALFQGVTDAVRIDADTVVVVDADNHCLRGISFSTGEVATVAGKCREGGSINGVFGVNRLQGLSYATLREDHRELVFSINTLRDCVKRLSLDSFVVGDMGTCASPGTYTQPAGVAAHGNVVFIAFAEGLAVMDVDTGTIASVGGGVPLLKAGTQLLLDRSVPYISSMNFVLAAYSAGNQVVIVSRREATSYIADASLFPESSGPSSTQLRYVQIASRPTHMFLHQNGTAVLSVTDTQLTYVACFFPRQPAAPVERIAGFPSTMMARMSQPHCAGGCRNMAATVATVDGPIPNLVRVVSLGGTLYTITVSNGLSEVRRQADGFVAFTVFDEIIDVVAVDSMSMIVWISRSAMRLQAAQQYGLGLWRLHNMTAAEAGRAIGAEDGRVSASSTRLRPSTAAVYDHKSLSVFVATDQGIVRLFLADMTVQLVIALRGAIPSQVQVSNGRLAYATSNGLTLTKIVENGTFPVLSWWAFSLFDPAEQRYVLLPCGEVVFSKKSDGSALLYHYNWKTHGSTGGGDFVAGGALLAGSDGWGSEAHLSANIIQMSLEDPTASSSTEILIIDGGKIRRVTLGCLSRCESARRTIITATHPNYRLFRNVLGASQDVISSYEGNTIAGSAAHMASSGPLTTILAQVGATISDGTLFSEQASIHFLAVRTNDPTKPLPRLVSINASAAQPTPVDVTHRGAFLTSAEHVTVATNADGDKVLVVHFTKPARCLAALTVETRDFHKVISRTDLTSCSVGGGVRPPPPAGGGAGAGGEGGLGTPSAPLPPQPATSGTSSTTKLATVTGVLADPRETSCVIVSEVHDSFVTIRRFDLVTGLWRSIYIESFGFADTRGTNVDSGVKVAGTASLSQPTLRSFAVSKFTNVADESFELLLVLRSVRITNASFAATNASVLDTHFLTLSGVAVASADERTFINTTSFSVDATMAVVLGTNASGSILAMNPADDTLTLLSCGTVPVTRVALPPDPPSEPVYAFANVSGEGNSSFLCTTRVSPLSRLARVSWAESVGRTDIKHVVNYGEPHRFDFVAGANYLSVQFSFSTGLRTNLVVWQLEGVPRNGDILEVSSVTVVASGTFGCSGALCPVIVDTSKKALYIGERASGVFRAVAATTAMPSPRAVLFVNSAFGVLVSDSQQQVIMRYGPGGEIGTIGVVSKPGFQDGSASVARFDNVIALQHVASYQGITGGVIFVVEQPQYSHFYEPSSYSRLRMVAVVNGVVTTCFATRLLLDALSILDQSTLVAVSASTTELLVITATDSQMTAWSMVAHNSSDFHRNFVGATTLAVTSFAVRNTTSDIPMMLIGDGGGVTAAFCTPSDGTSPYFIVEHAWPKEVTWLPHVAVGESSACTGNSAGLYGCRFSAAMTGTWTVDEATFPTNIDVLDLTGNNFGGVLNFSAVRTPTGSALDAIILENNKYTATACCLRGRVADTLEEIHLNGNLLGTPLNVSAIAESLNGSSVSTLRLRSNPATSLSRDITFDRWPSAIRVDVDGSTSPRTIGYVCGRPHGPLGYKVYSADGVTATDTFTPADAIPAHCAANCPTGARRNIAHSDCPAMDPVPTLWNAVKDLTGLHSSWHQDVPQDLWDGCSTVAIGPGLELVCDFRSRGLRGYSNFSAIPADSVVRLLLDYNSFTNDDGVSASRLPTSLKELSVKGCGIRGALDIRSPNNLLLKLIVSDNAFDEVVGQLSNFIAGSYLAIDGNPNITTLAHRCGFDIPHTQYTLYRRVGALREVIEAVKVVPAVASSPCSACSNGEVVNILFDDCRAGTYEFPELWHVVTELSEKHASWGEEQHIFLWKGCAREQRLGAWRYECRLADGLSGAAVTGKLHMDKLPEGIGLLEIASKFGGISDVLDITSPPSSLSTLIVDGTGVTNIALSSDPHRLANMTTLVLRNNARVESPVSVVTAAFGASGALRQLSVVGTQATIVDAFNVNLPSAAVVTFADLGSATQAVTSIKYRCAAPIPATYVRLTPSSVSEKLSAGAPVTICAEACASGGPDVDLLQCYLMSPGGPTTQAATGTTTDASRVPSRAPTTGDPTSSAAQAPTSNAPLDSSTTTPFTTDAPAAPTTSPTTEEPFPPTPDPTTALTIEVSTAVSPVATTASPTGATTVSTAATTATTTTPAPVTTDAPTNTVPPVSEWCAADPMLDVRAGDLAGDVTRLKLRDLIDGDVRLVAVITRPARNAFANTMSTPGHIYVVGGRTRASVVNVTNLTHVVFTLSGAEGVRPTDSYSVELRFKKTGLQCPTFATPKAANGDGLRAAPGDADVDDDSLSFRLSFVGESRPLGQTVVQSAQATTLATGSAASLTGSPTTVSQVSRAQMLLSLASCSYSHTAPLDITQSPMMMAFGSAKGAYYRGAVLGAIVLMACIAVLHLLAGVAWFAAFPNYRRLGVRVGLMAAIKRVHFPGLQVVAFTILLPGLAMATMATFVHGPDDADPFVATLGLLVTVAAIGYLTLPIFWAFDADFVKDELFDERTGEPVTMGVVHKFFHGEHRWQDRGHFFKNSHGPLFMDFTATRRWFLIVDLSVTAISGLLDGVRPSTTAGCVSVAIGVTVVNTSLLIALLALRPFAAMFNQLQALINAVIVAVASALMLASLIETNDEALSEAGESVAITGVYVAAVKTIIDIIVMIQKIVSRLNTRRKEKRQPDLAEPLLRAEPGAGDGTSPTAAAERDTDGSVSMSDDGKGYERGQHQTFHQFNLDEDDFEGLPPAPDDFDEASAAAGAMAARGQRAFLGKSELHDQIRRGLNTTSTSDLDGLLGLEQQHNELPMRKSTPEHRGVPIDDDLLDLL